MSVTLVADYRRFLYAVTEEQRMGTTPPVNPQYPQYPAQPQMGAPPPKKGMGPLGWVLIGCGGIVVLILIGVLVAGLFVMHKARQAGVDPELMRRNPGLAAAKMLVAASPDLTVISEDDGRGILRVHDSKQNKNFIVSFEDARRGKLTLQEEGKDAVTLSSSGNGDTGTFEATTKNGSIRIGAGGPVNMPSWLPSYPGSQPKATVTSEDAQRKSAQFTFTTGDSVEKVQSFYKDALASGGLKVTNSSVFSTGNSSSGIVSAETDGKQREVVVTFGTQNGQTAVSVTWNERK
jgi:hypothetical protein